MNKFSKRVFTMITTILICASLTACNKQDPVSDQSSAPDSVTDSVPDPLDDTSSTASETGTSSVSGENSTESDPESKPVEKIRGIYGETEIPDVNWRGLDSKNFETIKDYALAIAERDAMRLDSMVFETHELGDYKISLVGEGVWVDKERSTDKIYAEHLVVEVEKNGVQLEDRAGYRQERNLGGPQDVTYTVIEDKIGSYLDVYDMDVPVIAMKYYFDYDIPNAVDRVSMFSTIQDGGICCGFLGKCGEGTSLFVEYLEVSEYDHTYYYTIKSGEKPDLLHPFGESKFKVADGKTLIDEAEGIKYTFDFSDPMLLERYTAEKLV